jgi:predicted dinucleotide-binding enzyme
VIAKVNIGILGAGNVGGTLGQRMAGVGHSVKFGVPDPSKPAVLELLRAVGANAAAGTVAEAAAFGEAVVLAVPWSAARDALVGAGSLSGKVLFDCTNPVKPDLSGLEIGHTTSAGEHVAAWAPGARVVKIFNTTGAGNMANCDYGGQASTMFYAGDDMDAKRVAHQLAQTIGFDPVDAGPLANARLLEPLALLWIYMAYGGGQGPNIAFRLMHRD